METKPYEKKTEQEKFESQREYYSDREIQMEMLYAQQLIIWKLDKIRANTNTLIWWLVVLPILAGIIIGLILGNM